MIAPPFSESVSALGVLINVGSMCNGTIVIDNTAGRKSDIVASLAAVLSSGYS